MHRRQACVRPANPQSLQERPHEFPETRPASLRAGVAFGPLAAPALAAKPDVASQGGRYALLVGVHKYSEAKELRPLPYADNDVTELAQVLRDGGYNRDNVVLMTQTIGADELRFMPMKARILKELRLLLANRTAADTVILAFAGHGVVFKDDPVSYFCPADAQLDDKETLLSLTDVYRRLEKCPASTQILMVDACRNDPLADKSRAPSRLALESVTRPPEPAKDGGVAAFFSCSRGQKAYEDEKSQHGAFFHFVIDGLRGKAAARDQVTLLDLGAYVTRHVGDLVRVEYGAEQKPELSGDVQGSAVLAQTPAFLAAFRRGGQLLAKGDYAKAAAELTEALRLNPKFAPAQNDRGVAYRRSGDNDKAMADFDAAVRLDPRYAFAVHNRGLVWRDKGAYDKAIADFDEALKAQSSVRPRPPRSGPGLRRQEGLRPGLRRLRRGRPAGPKVRPGLPPPRRRPQGAGRSGQGPGGL